MSRRVHLNVGGTVFETTATTLEACDFFATLLKRTSPDALFVDRDPTHFRHILNFLRGALTYPPTNRQELWYEADFYGLPDLQRVLEEMERNDKTVTHWLERIHDRLSSLA